jgi:hypothetical protein
MEANMGLIPNFEEDVFISYAHIDNEPLTEGLKGWVETLHERLSIRLSQLLGERVNIWRDPELQGNEVFADTLVERLQNTAILISVISPRYVKSDWCLKELSEFGRFASQKGNLRVGDKMRVFKVVKTYVSISQHPLDMQGLLGYEFFEYDQARERAKEFNPDISPSRDQRYWDKLEDLANEIQQMISYLRSVKTSVTPIPAVPSGKTVYVAETTWDRREDRDRIRRELQLHGHQVLPREELPPIGSELRRIGSENLQQCQLSIHMIGARRGIIPEEEEKSIVELQYEMAQECGDGLQRIIWMPKDLKAQEETHQKFLDNLRLGLTTDGRTDLIEENLEELKTIMLDKLSEKQKAREVEPDSAADEMRSVYLLCNKQDIDDAAMLQDYLCNQGLMAILPAVEGSDEELIQIQNEWLKMCDGVLIYFGRANEIWLQQKQIELLKIFGQGRAKPFLAKGVYISGPQSGSKDRVRAPDGLIIKNYGEFSPEPLQPFLTRLQKAKGA